MDKKEKKNFEVVQVATETEPKIKDIETGESYSLIEAVCLMWEDIKQIKKGVA